MEKHVIKSVGTLLCVVKVSQVYLGDRSYSETPNVVWYQDRSARETEPRELLSILDQTHKGDAHYDLFLLGETSQFPKVG